jgi:hypothetical protein
VTKVSDGGRVGPVAVKKGVDREVKIYGVQGGA